MKRKMSCKVCGYEEISDCCGWSMIPLVCCEAERKRGKAHARKGHK